MDFLTLEDGAERLSRNFSMELPHYSGVPWEEGREGWGVQTPLTPEIPKSRQSLTGLQIERKMFSVAIPTS